MCFNVIIAKVILLTYDNIVKAKFISRPNRFLANVIIDNHVEICHVKNTGRCKELLIEGVTVYLQKNDKSNRKTKYDLISVVKDGKIVNIDSQAPNKVFNEWLQTSDFFGNILRIKPEYKYKDSRFDFYLETDEKKILVEVKGVTLENNKIVKFPDAPTKRGTKHLCGLSECVSNGYEAYTFFVAQLKEVNYFEPNIIADKEFYKALLNAKNRGVNIICVNCNVSENSLTIDKFIDVRL